MDTLIYFPASTGQAVLSCLFNEDCPDLLHIFWCYIYWTFLAEPESMWCPQRTYFCNPPLVLSLCFLKVLFNVKSITTILWMFSSGLQVILPEYLQEKFVQSALSYIMCNGEGEYVCRSNQCICQCADEFPQCNCPTTDLQIMENTLRGMSESWAASYKDFENSGNFETFLPFI